MSKFDFKPVEPENKDIIDSYSYKYGENSCQHSLVSMYGHFDKYGDSFFEHEGWLYICRTGLCDESRNVYLCPLGDPDDDGAFAVALKNIMEDAHSEGKRVVFETVTANAKNRINSLMPGIFRFDYSRDYAEYVYSREKLIRLPGSHLSKRRYQYKAFYRRYEGRVRIEPIREEMIPDILSFQARWMDERMSEGDNPQLFEENGAIIRELGAYSKLGLFGIVIYVDDNIAGYAFGTPLSENCFDVLCEKGDRSTEFIYRVLKRELPAYCSEDYKFFNWEEDVGDVGLRQVKLDYYPNILIDKYRAEEVYE